MLNVLNPRDSRELQPTESRNLFNLHSQQTRQRKVRISIATRKPQETYTLLNELDIIETDADTPRPTQMPARFEPQVLDHDAGQHDELGLDAVQDAVVGEVQAVGDFDREPSCLLVSVSMVRWRPEMESSVKWLWIDRRCGTY